MKATLMPKRFQLRGVGYQLPKAETNKAAAHRGRLKHESSGLAAHWREQRRSYRAPKVEERMPSQRFSALNRHDLDALRPLLLDPSEANEVIYHSTERILRNLVVSMSRAGDKESLYAALWNGWRPGNVQSKKILTHTQKQLETVLRTLPVEDIELCASMPSFWALMGEQYAPCFSRALSADQLAALCRVALNPETHLTSVREKAITLGKILQKLPRDEDYTIKVTAIVTGLKALDFTSGDPKADQQRRLVTELSQKLAERNFVM